MERIVLSCAASWGRADEGSSPGFTLLSEVGAWLETLPDVEGNAELRRIQEAVQDLDTEETLRKSGSAFVLTELGPLASPRAPALGLSRITGELVALSAST